MYQEPYHDEENLRLRRKPREEEKIQYGWIFMPAFIGILVSIVFTVVLPSVFSSMKQQYKLDRIADKALEAVNTQFSHLVALEWDETQLWLSIPIGAVLGIIARFAFRDEKM